MGGGERETSGILVYSDLDDEDGLPSASFVSSSLFFRGCVFMLFHSHQHDIYIYIYIYIYI